MTSVLKAGSSLWSTSMMHYQSNPLISDVFFDSLEEIEALISQKDLTD